MSSAFCLLYKLFTLKLTKKQVIGLITHKDSPYIRGLGFMYIRYVCTALSIMVGCQNYRSIVYACKAEQYAPWILETLIVNCTPNFFGLLTACSTLHWSDVITLWHCLDVLVFSIILILSL